MTRARNQLISLDTTPYYHCISRCVRRAFLCGEDALTGNNYEHRKTWAVERLRELAGVFSIDICAFAIMSSHSHIILRVDSDRAAAWSHIDVVEQWAKLHKLPFLVSRYIRGECATEAEEVAAEAIITTWRDRLIDISWFMSSLNEHLARRANAEDNCTGRFWEGRFKSQALLDDAAVLTCMSYVDLNPVRAAMAETPEASDFTSIQQRIREYVKQTGQSCHDDPDKPLVDPVPLMPLIKQRDDTHPNAIGFTTVDYLDLVDWAGRAVVEGKRGAISGTVPPILQRLGLEPERYLDHLCGRAATEQPMVIGHFEQIKAAAESLGRCFIKGIGEARRLYSPPSTI